MSNPEQAPQAPGASEAFARLESAVRRLIRRSAELKAELRSARERNRELMELLGPVAEGEAGPESVLERLRAAEDERREYAGRLERGREVVERMMARIRFLEDQDG
ncbi:MAG: hypothetical protein OXE73_03920 [Gammaproteobacteria bacterium]|nr:hypothetical protein [Gammaproteobacteria bacterium]